MDITDVIADLRYRRDNVYQAILALENIATAQPRRRGRPRSNGLGKKRLQNESPSGAAFRAKTMAMAG